MLKLAVFVSGRGSNLKSIISKIKIGELNAAVLVVVSNVKDCKAFEICDSEEIPRYVVDENLNDLDFINYQKLVEILENNKIDLIVLAGFLKKIPVSLLSKFKNKIINIHPALLPAFGGKGMYGINVHKAVFNSSAKVSGATVHFVDEIYDNGKIIDQKVVDISDVKSPEEIAEKVLKIEHELLPNVIKKFSENKVKIIDNRVVII
jgi:phosphoribosylglycinamide formyltransferase 1